MEEAEEADEAEKAAAEGYLKGEYMHPDITKSITHNMPHFSSRSSPPIDERPTNRPRLSPPNDAAIDPSIGADSGQSTLTSIANSLKRIETIQDALLKDREDVNKRKEVCIGGEEETKEDRMKEEKK